MTTLECLENEIFSLPKCIGNENMIDYLEKEFKDYQELLKKLSEKNLVEELKKHLKDIENVCSNFILSLKNYQKGFIESAYIDFKKSMYILKPTLFPKQWDIYNMNEVIHTPYYRARKGSNQTFTKAQMFHLPFSKREFSNNQRFSVPGLPCLYLSNSIYVCWEELNRPPINTFQVSRFQQENFKLKILNISHTPIQIKEMYKSTLKNDIKNNNGYDQFVLYFLINWPLTLVCSLNAVNKIAPFKHEYIFPQFLLQWVTSENDIDGIKYFSIKSNPHNKTDFSKFSNYVFPPKEMASGDYCNHLKKSFKLTESLSFELLKISDPDFIFISKEWLEKVKHKVKMDNIRLELIKGYSMFYGHTLFGKIEFFLQNIDAEFLSEND